MPLMASALAPYAKHLLEKLEKEKDEHRKKTPQLEYGVASRW